VHASGPRNPRATTEDTWVKKKPGKKKRAWIRKWLGATKGEGNT